MLLGRYLMITKHVDDEMMLITINSQMSNTDKRLTCVLTCDVLVSKHSALPDVISHAIHFTICRQEVWSRFDFK